MPGPISAAKPYSARDKACDCLIGILFMTVLAFVICITPAITRLLILIQPKLPNFTIHSSSLSKIPNLANDTVHADWDVNLMIDNLDRNGFHFDQIRASVILQATDTVVSDVSIPAFEQNGKSRESVAAVFRNMTIESSEMRMEVTAMADYRGWTWPVKRDFIRVVCRDAIKNPPLTNVRCEVSGRWKKLVSEWTSLFWDYLYVLVIFLGILLLSF